jgi:protein transport protein SEC13
VWETVTINAHAIGTNSVSWAPSTVTESLVTNTADSTAIKRFASGGCDNLIKIFSQQSDGNWKEDACLEGHTDWVRDVAFAPSFGLTKKYLASCSQVYLFYEDRHVFIWVENDGKWTKRHLTNEPFSAVVWRVSWSTGGNILAVSCGDNKITLWKEKMDGEFIQISDLNQ